MEDLDFDILYQVKTPFFLGLPSKALSEANAVEIDKDDTNNQDLQILYKLRILHELNDTNSLKAEI